MCLRHPLPYSYLIPPQITSLPDSQVTGSLVCHRTLNFDTQPGLPFPFSTNPSRKTAVLNIADQAAKHPVVAQPKSSASEAICKKFLDISMLHSNDGVLIKGFFISPSWHFPHHIQILIIPDSSCM